MMTQGRTGILLSRLSSGETTQLMVLLAYQLSLYKQPPPTASSCRSSIITTSTPTTPTTIDQTKVSSQLSLLLPLLPLLPLLLLSSCWSSPRVVRSSSSLSSSATTTDGRRSAAPAAPAAPAAAPNDGHPSSSPSSSRRCRIAPANGPSAIGTFGDKKTRTVGGSRRLRRLHLPREGEGR